jgi:hypothetical protein
MNFSTFSDEMPTDSGDTFCNITITPSVPVKHTTKEMSIIHRQNTQEIQIYTQKEA